MRSKAHEASGCLTQEECAERLGFSRERVGAIERKALRKLRALIQSDPRLGEYLRPEGVS